MIASTPNCKAFWLKKRSRPNLVRYEVELLHTLLSLEPTNPKIFNILLIAKKSQKSENI